jgi:uncharacterized iron-regulated protein
MMNSRNLQRSAGPLFAGLFLLPAVTVAEEIDPERLTQLSDADVIILGEVHDNPTHHENQALAIAELSPRALVFEMFGPDAALRATPDVRKSSEALAHVLGWDEGGWPDFSLYYPIFSAGEAASIFGGALPRETVRKAVSNGAAQEFGPGAPLFGLDKPLDEDEQAIREAAQAAAHCDALPEDILPGMVEAQRLRDAALARAVIAAYSETGGPVAVITGNGHARRDWGVPRMLERAMPDLSITVVGQLEHVPEAPPPYDYWLVTEAAERDDPCAVFR